MIDFAARNNSGKDSTFIGGTISGIKSAIGRPTISAANTHKPFRPAWFQLVTTPFKSRPMIASSDDSTIEARRDLASSSNFVCVISRCDPHAAKEQAILNKPNKIVKKISVVSRGVEFVRFGIVKPISTGDKSLQKFRVIWVTLNKQVAEPRADNFVSRSNPYWRAIASLHSAR